MGKKDNKLTGSEVVQVIELTMDNTEDQDELNRRLRKPGEPPYDPLAKNGFPKYGESTTDSEGKKKGGKKKGKKKGTS